MDVVMAMRGFVVAVLGIMVWASANDDDAP